MHGGTRAQVRVSPGFNPYKANLLPVRCYGCGGVLANKTHTYDAAIVRFKHQFTHDFTAALQELAGDPAATTAGGAQRPLAVELRPAAHRGEQPQSAAHWWDAPAWSERTAHIHKARRAATRAAKPASLLSRARRGWRARGGGPPPTYVAPAADDGMDLGAEGWGRDVTDVLLAGRSPPTTHNARLFPLRLHYKRVEAWVAARAGFLAHAMAAGSARIPMSDIPNIAVRHANFAALTHLRVKHGCCRTGLTTRTFPHASDAWVKGAMARLRNTVVRERGSRALGGAMCEQVELAKVGRPERVVRVARGSGAPCVRACGDEDGDVSMT